MAGLSECVGMLEILDKYCYLDKNVIHVWGAVLPVNKIELDFYSSCLSQDEKERASKFRFSEVRERYTCARGILRCILSKYVLQEPEEIEFFYTFYGKPYILNSSTIDVRFNLSHSKKCVLYAITQDVDIGVDIELLRPIDFDSISRSFFSNYEYLQLVNTPLYERRKKFYEIWTCKEAFVKKIGKGLAYSLNAFDVHVYSDQTAKIIRIENDVCRPEDHELKIFSPFNGYVAAIVGEKPFKGLYYSEWQSPPI